MPELRLPLSLVGLAGLSACVECYSSEAIRYHEAAQQALVAECVRNIQTCNSNKRLFWEAGGGAYVNLYETQDPKVVGAVAAKLIEMRSKVPMPKVVLTVYSSKHGQPKVQYRQIIIE
jgi:hypothetical protein